MTTDFSQLTRVLNPAGLQGLTEGQIIRRKKDTGLETTNPADFANSDVYLRQGTALPTGANASFYNVPQVSPLTSGQVGNNATNLPSSIFSAYNLQVPQTIPSKLVSDSFNQSTTYGDIQKLLSTQSDLRAKTLAAMQPSQTETDLNTKLAEIRKQADELTLNAQAGIQGVQNKVIPLEFMPGQEKNITDRANLQLQSLGLQEKNLLTSLGLAQEARQSNANLLGKEGEFVTDDINNQFKIQSILDTQEKSVLEQANKLRDDARGVLTTILEKFKGLDINSLDANTQLQLATVAAQSGVPLSLLVSGMKAVKDQQDYENLLNAKKANNTSVPSSIQEYQFAKEQGYKGTLLEFMNAQKSSSGTNLTASERYNLALKLVDDAQAPDLKTALAMIDNGGLGNVNVTTNVNANAKQIAQAIKQVEGGDYTAHGGSGEYGAYQFMPATWSQYASEYLAANGGNPNQNLQRTPANQDAVAEFKVQQWLDQGYTPSQVASLWNSGKPDFAGNVGINKYGQRYDVPAYVNKFNNALSNLTTGTQEKGSTNPLYDDIQTTVSGLRYIDLSNYTDATSKKLAQRLSKDTGLPTVNKDGAEALQNIDNARLNQNAILAQVMDLLPKDAAGRVISAPNNKLQQYLQTQDQLAAFNSWRTAAINSLRATAGSKGLRINQAEIAAAVENDIPKITDTIGVALQKYNNIKTMLDNAEASLIVKDRSTINNSPFSSTKNTGNQDFRTQYGY